MRDTPTTTITERKAPGAALMATIKQLKDRHRLGIHVWEDGRAFGDPECLATLRRFPASTLAEHVAAREAPLHSCSLLLSTASGLAMAPFYSDTAFNAGFLLNYDEHQPHPPLVLQASGTTLDSGNDPYAKKPPFHSDDGIPELTRLYRRYPSHASWVRAVATEPGRALTAQQLDALGRAMENPAFLQHPVPFYFMDDRHLPPGIRIILEYNEILSAVTDDHILAIAMPQFDDHVAMRPWYPAATRFMAALSGLAQSTDYPVVIHHVNGPQAGGHSYVGASRAEFQSAARAAWQELGDNRHRQDFLKLVNPQTPLHQTLVEQSRQQLGIDLNASPTRFGHPRFFGRG